MLLSARIQETVQLSNDVRHTEQGRSRFKRSRRSILLYAVFSLAVAFDTLLLVSSAATTINATGKPTPTATAAQEEVSDGVSGLSLVRLSLYQTADQVQRLASEQHAVNLYRTQTPSRRKRDVLITESMEWEQPEGHVVVAFRETQLSNGDPTEAAMNISLHVTNTSAVSFAALKNGLISKFGKETEQFTMAGQPHFLSMWCEKGRSECDTGGPSMVAGDTFIVLSDCTFGVTTEESDI